VFELSCIAVAKYILLQLPHVSKAEQELLCSCRCAKDERANLSQPIGTRWGTHVDMAKSLTRYRKVLEQAVDDDVFCSFARKAHKEYLTEGELEIERLAELLAAGDAQMEEDMPLHVRQNSRFAAVYRGVKSATFWASLQQYVSMNSPVTEAITFLSGTSACLSDACAKLFQLDSFINSLNTSDVSEMMSYGELEPRAAN
jgi:hypothetical protein